MTIGPTAKALRTGAWRGNSLLPPTLNAALGPVATVLSRHPDLWRIARGAPPFHGGPVPTWHSRALRSAQAGSGAFSGGVKLCGGDDGAEPNFFRDVRQFHVGRAALSLSLIALACIRVLCVTVGWSTWRLAWSSRRWQPLHQTKRHPVGGDCTPVASADVRRHAAWHIGVLLPLAAGVCMHIWFSVRPDGVASPR